MATWEPPLTDFAEKYQWCTRGRNCAFCNMMEGRVYELDVYISSTVYPGFHPNCNCYLIKVPIETPSSDLDIFGSALNMRNDSWLEILFGNWENLWQPMNLRLANELLSFSEPGITAREAMRRMKLADKANRYGIFGTNKGITSGMQNLGIGWNTWQTVTADIYQTFGQLLTSAAGLPPKPKEIKPTSPLQSYHNKLWNLR